MASQVNHFKEFATQAEYEAYIQPDDYAKPLVALVEATGTVMFPQGGGGGGGDCGNPIMKSVDVEDFSGMAFDGLAQITEVNFPAGIMQISNYSLYRCSSLTSVDLPSVLTIGEYAFYGCSSLTSVTLPSTLTSIGNDAFRVCIALTTCDLSGTSATSIGSSAFQGCSALTSVTFPSGLTTIGPAAFQGCSALTSVTLPSGATSIGNSAFRYCSSLTSVTVEATTPPTLGTNVFSDTSANLAIYVPAASVETYKAASRWSTYASKIQAIPATP